MDFQNAINFIFGQEGGYSNDRHDRGGETNFGISKRANPDIDIANLTREKAQDIYKQRYWDAIDADSLPPNLRLVALDTAVNMGVPTAIEMIDNSNGTPESVLAQRADRYKQIIQRDPSQAKFANGWSNRLADLAAATESNVASMTSKRMGDQYILNQLIDAGHGPEIEYAQAQGYSPAEIVAKFGGAPTQKVKDAQTKVAGQDFLTNLAQGAGNAVSDIKLGAKQIFTTDPTQTAALQAEARANEADPERQALSRTTGGQMGNLGVKVAPAAAAALIPGGLPAAIAAQAAAGGVTAALEPTTADGQRTRKVMLGTASGGGVAGLAGLAGKAAGALGGKLLAGDGQAAERLALAEQHGLTPTAAMVDSRLGAVADAIPAARAANDALATKDMSRALLKGIGVEGDELTTAAISQAKNSIYKEADALLAKAPVTADASGITSKLDDIVSNYAKNTLETYRSSEVAGVAKDIVRKIEAGDMTGAGLVQARKNIITNAYKADGETRQALKQIGQVIDDHLAAVAPEAKAVLQEANAKWQNLQVIKNVYKRANGQAFSARQLATSVKTVGKDLFESGKAPYQDLADAALKLYGTDHSKSLAGLLAKKLAGSTDGLLTGAAVFAPQVGIPTLAAKKLGEALLKKASTSTNPNFVARLGAKPTVSAAQNHYLAKALGSTASLIGNTK